MNHQPLSGAAAKDGAGPTPDRLRRLALLALATFTFLATVAVYAVHGTMPANALKLPGESKERLILFLPEAWKFFTRDPREERLSVFRREPSGAWSRFSAPVNADPHNA